MSKFDDETPFITTAETTVKKLVHTLFDPISNAAQLITQKVSTQSVAQKAASDVSEEIKNLSRPPETLEQYILFGSHYVAKKVFYIMLLLVIVAPALFINYAWPTVRSRFFTRTMPIDSADIADYTGKVRLTDRSTGTVLFEGELDSGRINGFGRLYDYSGRKHYEGNFTMEVYQIGRAHV